MSFWNISPFIDRSFSIEWKALMGMSFILSTNQFPSDSLSADSLSAEERKGDKLSDSLSADPPIAYYYFPVFNNSKL